MNIHMHKFLIYFKLNPVYKLCKISKVSRSGYYNWKNRKKLLSDKKVQDLQLKEVLLEAHKK